jgi:hypothetical protein
MPLAVVVVVWWCGGVVVWWCGGVVVVGVVGITAIEDGGECVVVDVVGVVNAVGAAARTHGGQWWAW